MIVALTALGHVWFQLPQCFPYQALYIVSLILIIPSPIKPQPKAAPLVMAAAVIAMGWSAAEQFSAMIFADKVHKALSTGAAADYNEHWLGDDLRHSGDRWFAAARYYVSTASLQSADKIEDDSRLGWYVYFMHNARDAAKDPSIQARASSLELLYDYYLFGGFNEPRFDALRHEATVGLEDAVMRMLHKAPERDDYETLFLLNLESYTKNDKPRQIKILERMLAIAPNHRGALWQLGHMLVATKGREAEGRRMTLKAVQLHVERVYPITDAQLRVATGLQ